jgi:hypothetical protein
MIDYRGLPNPAAATGISNIEQGMSNYQVGPSCGVAPSWISHHPGAERREIHSNRQKLVVDSGRRGGYNEENHKSGSHPKQLVTLWDN